MKDPLFGEIKWGHLDRWGGVARFDEVEGYGAALDEKDEPGPARRESAGPLPPTRRQVEAKAQLRELAKTL